jgi:5-formyltetrahydrofolate cyclo-ligase
MREDIRSQKKELRSIILTQRDTLSLEERRKKSESIHSRLFSLPACIAATTVALFVSFKSEVLTDSIIRETLRLGKVVAVPFTDRRSNTLLLSSITDYPADLAPGTWEILEPIPDRLRPIALETMDLIVTPGVVFDHRGYRIGYGGGFYDKLIRASEKKTIFVGLAFELQVVDEVPCDSAYDQPVDIIITEDRVIRCER